MSNILITGGAGYIGSHVVKALLREGHLPVVYDNLDTGHRQAVKQVPFVPGDLSDATKLSQTLRSYSIDSVMHFAAHSQVGESARNPFKYFTNNVRGGLQLLEGMEEHGVRKIVFSSSAAVYGEPLIIPIPEDHPCLPGNPYGETKWILEKVLQAYHAWGKMDYISLRYFNAAGADPEGELGEDHSPETHLIPIGLKAALSSGSVPIFGSDYDTPDGTCIRDYIHVTDLADAHLLALARLNHGGPSGIYNLGNGNGHSVRQVLETIGRVTGRKLAALESPRRPGDPARLVASSEKIVRELGWTPRYPDLETIVDTAWQWHRSHPNGYNTENHAVRGKG
jgi:UDP-glucose 4-epimerase